MSCNSGNATFPALLGAALGHLLVMLGDVFVGLVAVGGLLLFRSRLTTGVGGVFRLPTLLFPRLRAGSAFRMVTYVDAIQPQTNLFDGLFVHSRFAVGAPLADGGQNAMPNPTLIRTDTKKPVLVLESETDVPRHLTARQPDTARYRLWEVAGTGHFDEDGLHALTGIPKEQMVSTPPLGCAQRINSASQRYVVDTAIHDIARWAAGGPAPPKAPLVAITTGDTPIIQRDELGNARGGIRLPQLEAPVATLSGAPGGGPGFRSLFGTTTAFDAARFSSLCPNHRDYVTAFSKATDRVQRDGFLLPAAAKEAKAEASRSGVAG